MGRIYQAAPASALEKARDFGPLGDLKVSVTGQLSSKSASVAVFTVSDGGKQLFIITSDELERAGYSFELFGYCFGWLTYKGERRPVVCDAPMMAPGYQDRPITFDSGTGQWSNGTGRNPPQPSPAYLTPPSAIQ